MAKGTVSLVFGLLGLFGAIISFVIDFAFPLIIIALSIVAIIVGLIGTIKEFEIDRYLSIAGLTIGIIAFIMGLVLLTMTGWL